MRPPRHVSPLRLLGVALLFVSCGGAAPGGVTEVAMSSTAGDAVQVLPVERKATVLLFTATDCPISNGYAPEVNRIVAEYEPRGVDFYLVYADADTDAASVERHRADYGYTMPGLLDADHGLVERCEATVTPEVALFAPDARLVYRGRIDDTYPDYGKQRAAPRRRDLRLALDAVLAGRTPELARTEAVGCFIPERSSAK